MVAIIGDPFYTVSVLPWHNLLFWYSAHQVLKTLPGITINVPGVYMGRYEVVLRGDYP